MGRLVPQSKGIQTGETALEHKCKVKKLRRQVPLHGWLITANCAYFPHSTPHFCSSPLTISLHSAGCPASSTQIVEAEITAVCRI